MPIYGTKITSRIIIFVIICKCTFVKAQIIPDSIRKYHCYTSLAYFYLKNKNYYLADSLITTAFRYFQFGGRDQLIAARIKASIGDSSATIKFLKSSVLKGMDLKNIVSQSEFTQMKELNIWDDFVNQYEVLHKQYQCTLNLDRYIELFYLNQSDQILRKFGKEFINITKINYDDIKRMDSLSLKRLVLYIEKFGFPNVNDVGYRSIDNLYFLLIHIATEYNKEFELVKTIIERGVSEGQFDPGYYAGIMDFHSYKNNQFEIYGSTMFDEDSLGNNILRPIGDIKAVDSLREMIGLEPLSIHMSNWNILRFPEGYNFNMQYFRSHINDYCNCKY